MANSTEWANAFLRCAREDLNAAEQLLSVGSGSAGTIAMLFQMVFEKIGKAYLIAHAKKQPQDLKTHKAATVALRTIRLNTKWLWDGAHRGQQWKAALALIKVLEEAQPAVAATLGRSEVLEYPWEDPTTQKALIAVLGIPEVRDISGSGATLAPQLIKLGRHLIGKLS